MSKTLEGKLTICRTQSSNGDSWVTIRVEDETSRTIIVDAKISMENFANAVTGLGCQPVEFTTGNLSLVGKKLEHKTVTVPFPDKLLRLVGDGNFSDKFEQWIDEVAKPHEVDGWRARRERYNWHRKKGNQFSFDMFRYVEE